MTQSKLLLLLQTTLLLLLVRLPSGFCFRAASSTVLAPSRIAPGSSAFRRRRRRQVSPAASSPQLEQEQELQNGPVVVKDVDSNNNDDGRLMLTTPFVRLYNDRSKLEAYMLIQAALIGMMGGAAVALFKESIEETRHVLYGIDFARFFLPFIPAFGGLLVGLLALPGSFPPGLKGSIQEVDKDARRIVSGALKPPAHPFGFLRKTAASVATLGSGSSLGPEGPSVEVGMSMSRFIMNIFPPIEYLFATKNSNKRLANADEAELIQRGRLLLSCGAAAGVSAGFNAPIAGVFFALEIVEGALADVEQADQMLNPRKKGPLGISAILVASVLAALVCQTILGNEMVLTVSNLSVTTPLNELPFYMVLGATCGIVSVLFSALAKACKSFFEGNLGPESVQTTVRQIPYLYRPAIGGLLCGVIGLAYPQILFFGYETLNALLNSLLEDSFGLILTLLVVKMVATALAAGSGLVGGTFAPSLFLGAMTGTAFHQVVEMTLPGNQIADSPAYAIVGAASVLAALFRAPLTASLLLFELVRDYDVILPLMVSAGLGSVVADLVENTVEQEQVRELRRDRDAVSWGDLADKQIQAPPSSEKV